MAYSEWNEKDLDDMFSDEDDDLQPNKTKQVYYGIRPEGPITGAIWERGKWIHVGGGRKRKRFDNDENEDGTRNSHTNLRNPKKRAKFIMKVEQSEIEHLTHTVKRTKPPRHLNPVALLQASELKSKFEQQSNKNKATIAHPEGFDAALDILSLSGNFKVSSTFNELPYTDPNNCRAKGNVYIPRRYTGDLLEYIVERFESIEKLYYYLDYTIAMQIMDKQTIFFKSSDANKSFSNKY
eukprot:126009_1